VQCVLGWVWNGIKFGRQPPTMSDGEFKYMKYQFKYVEYL